MELGLDGKVAMVLGAAGGLGAATATALAAEGATVVACDINDVALKELYNGDTPRIIPLAFDLSDLTAVDGAVDQVESQHEGVDILVNLTGGPPPTLASETPSSAYSENFQKLVAPVLHVTARVLPAMKAQGWGRIITSTSSGVIAPIPNLALSNVLRSSLVGWSKTLAAEVAADGVTVNVIVPGRIGTARIEQLDEARAKREGKDLDEIRRLSTQTIPLRRYGRPEEFGAVVAFLSGTSASYITGSMVRVDGGLLANV